LIITLDDSGIAVRETAFIARSPASTDIPGGFIWSCHLLPKIERQALSGIVDEFS
jgi:hypothetical protein